VYPGSRADSKVGISSLLSLLPCGGKWKPVVILSRVNYEKSVHQNDKFQEKTDENRYIWAIVISDIGHVERPLFEG